MAQSNGTKTASATAEPSRDDLMRQIEVLKADVAALTSSVGEYGKATGRAYADEARAKVGELRQNAEGHIDDVETYVRQNPATALGIAAGIGLLIGLMSGRR